MVKKRSVIRHRFRAKASRKKSNPLGSVGKFALGGVLFVGGSALASKVVGGLDEKLKMGLVAGFLWMLGGIFKYGAKVGIGFLAVALAMPYLGTYLGSGSVTSSGIYA